MRCFALPISLCWFVWNSFDHRDRCFMCTSLYCFILPLGIIDLSGFVNRHRAQTTIKIIIIIWQLPGAHFRVSSTMNFNDVDSVVVLHREMTQKNVFMSWAHLGMLPHCPKILFEYKLKNLCSWATTWRRRKPTEIFSSVFLSRTSKLWHYLPRTQWLIFYYCYYLCASFTLTNVKHMANVVKK